ncbi:MAG: hypothetical protein HUJ54_01290 [Erysipelotrichaceae bacterium]|nr:hypothetical protein [Erysipelotrichaceae bacterium]
MSINMLIKFMVLFPLTLQAFSIPVSSGYPAGGLIFFTQAARLSAEAGMLSEDDMQTSKPAAGFILLAVGCFLCLRYLLCFQNLRFERQAMYGIEKPVTEDFIPAKRPQ